jgi:uncharacterized protein (DUF885 family)
MMKSARATLVCLAVATASTYAQPQTGKPPLQLPPEVERTFSDPSAYVPDLTRLATTKSELRDTVDRFAPDRQAIQRFHAIPGSAERRERLRGFYETWLKKLPAINFSQLSRDGQVDYVLLRNYIEYQIALLGREARADAETAPLLPFAEDIIRLQEERQKLRFITADDAVKSLAAISEEVMTARRAIEDGTGGATAKPTPLAAVRAAQQVDRLRNVLAQWFGFYNGYDPAFTRSVPEAHQTLGTALNDYARLLRERVAGVKAGTDDIVGDPIGREGLLEDLAGEMIPYTPEELIEIGNREYAWCEREMKRASSEMGYGDDWMKALDAVKNAYVPRGQQPELIRNLALEAEAYLKKHDLVTVPPLAADIWRMGMMSPERQKVNPFFTGGETISVSYPTNTMSEEDSLMSMRGNGIHVSRATVHHELIPGHHLKGFMSARYNTHRNLFETPLQPPTG